ncbi:hypothetical protein GCM10010277_82580 [Streptomyces longisporoflavus]|nr:hypothetical protein GCM10010277_82580 [Streptomyces longisporoflavus]
MRTCFKPRDEPGPGHRGTPRTDPRRNPRSPQGSAPYWSLTSPYRSGLVGPQQSAERTILNVARIVTRSFDKPLLGND